MSRRKRVLFSDTAAKCSKPGLEQLRQAGFITETRDNIYSLPDNGPPSENNDDASPATRILRWIRNDGFDVLVVTSMDPFFGRNIDPDVSARRVVVLFLSEKHDDRDDLGMLLTVLANTLRKRFGTEPLWIADCLGAAEWLRSDCQGFHVLPTPWLGGVRAAGLGEGFRPVVPLSGPVLGIVVNTHIRERFEQIIHSLKEESFGVRVYAMTPLEETDDTIPVFNAAEYPAERFLLRCSLIYLPDIKPFGARELWFAMTAVMHGIRVVTPSPSAHDVDGVCHGDQSLVLDLYERLTTEQRVIVPMVEGRAGLGRISVAEQLSTAC